MISPPVDPIPGRPPSAEEEAALARLEQVAEEIRGLRFTSRVPARIQTREEITAFVEQGMDHDSMESARTFYLALGLLEPEVDVEQMVSGVLGEQIVGYYDPERDLLVVRDDVAGHLRAPPGGSPQGGSGGSGGSVSSALSESETVLVHELVHALQDQHLGLGERQERHRNIDEENAHASVVEGDATLAMVGYMARLRGGDLRSITQNVELLRGVMSQGGVGGGPELSNAPPIMRIPLLSRYLDGMIFCASLHRGGGWTSVDGAHRRPPVSSEQILHPERYLRDERPTPITLPRFSALELAGYVPVQEETLGELEMGIFFGQGTPEGRAASAAEGWGGDRVRVYRDSAGETAVVWYSAWDSEAEAAEADAAARRVASLLPPSRAAGQKVSRNGRALLILRDVPPYLQASVGADFHRFAGALPGPSGSP